ncbi:c-type cytochrome biogenesis protein CcsB [Nocardioides marmoriginsengisoli]|uniref:C-type cytochrome biogenesis protein CcsB n=1 Tax=Nocardioides marmoriginsengisoli TaxID=661483 RepID=A0A3N0CGC5_9ACTN|nr:c-type cytochrome biogenesis protein CcsB [Nocardioides marmoriginsengisoli]RNL62281.1 c-type cytochrome biogenesis protein CcsB [Nocardioides marmoriginsengisoli]
MSHAQFEVLSNQAVAICGAFYFIALLAHLAEWAAGRNVPLDADAAADAAAVSGTASAGTASAGSADTLVAVQESTEKMERFARWGLVATGVAAGVHLVAVVARGLAADPIRVPWGNMYEFTLTASLVVTIGYLALYRRFKLAWLSPVVTGFLLVVLMLDALLLYDPVFKLRDALQSPWLVIHVIAAIIATGAFTLGGMASVLYLIKERWLRNQGDPDRTPRRVGYLDRVPGLVQLDRFSYRVHAFAFPIWTFAALIAGPIWAEAAWGRYWGWDPKEVWAFITWVVYAAYLHARATAGWKGRAAAIIAIIGLLTLWFNFVGINFFFGSGSQHSYA